jgi:hypothetical protein
VQQEQVDRQINHEAAGKSLELGRVGIGKQPMLSSEDTTEYVNSFGPSSPTRRRRSRMRPHRKRSTARKLVAPGGHPEVLLSSTQEAHAGPFEGTRYKGELQRPATSQVVGLNSQFSTYLPESLTSTYGADISRAAERPSPKDGQPTVARSASAPAGDLLRERSKGAAGMERGFLVKGARPFSELSKVPPKSRAPGMANTKEMDFKVRHLHMRGSTRL